MRADAITVTPDTLNDAIDFDRVFYSYGDGKHIRFSPEPEPSLYDGELDSSGWTLLNGYSGQWSYSGPIMHDSEFIGGRMARDILDTRGYYVVLASYYSRCPECEDIDGEQRCARCESESYIEGWGVAFRDVDDDGATLED